MAQAPIEITISDVRKYLNCRQQWQFGGPQRMSLVPKTRALHFAFGDLIHQALEAYYTGGDPVSFFFDNGQRLLADAVAADPNGTVDVRLEDLLRLGPPLLSAYMRFAALHDDFTVVDTEKRQTIRLSDGLPSKFFSFKYDGLVQRRDGLYLKEFKTTQNLPTEADYFTYDLQSVAYQMAVEKAIGKPIKGMIYTFLRKKAPTVPQRLANGQLSKRKDIITLPETYKMAIEAYNLDPSQYKDILQLIKDKEESNYFRRYTVRATAHQKEEMFNLLSLLANEMGNPDTPIFANPERMRCNVCDYKHPCQLKQLGENWQYLLETEYMPAPERD